MAVSTQAAQEITIVDGEKNHIDEVVVFTDQAYIKRRIATEAAVGLNRFLVEIKAFHVDRDSIQASVYGQGEILSVQYCQVPVAAAVQDDVREFEEEKRQYEQQIKTLQRDKESINKQKKFLDSTVSYAESEIPRELKTTFPSPQNLQNILTFLEQSFHQFNQKETELEKQQELLEKKLLLVQRKLKKLKKPAQTNKQYIEIVFDAQQSQAIQIDVFYVAGQAFWEPVYKVDVPADLTAISMTTFAQIEQATGENWRDVKLSVSNAVPLKGGKLPDQQSWRLHPKSTLYQQPENYIMAAATAEVLAGADAGAADDFEEPVTLEDTAVQASYAQAERKQLPLAFEYVLPQAVSIEHGSGESMLPTSNEILEGDFFHLCMPAQDALVYLVCEAKIESTLLPGKLNIYFSGRFVASSYLGEKQAGQKLLINLGAEREVKVNREKITDKLTDSFFGVVDRLAAVRQFAYRIEIENMKNRSIHMRLIDAAPVSGSDRIQIKEVKFKPEPTRKNWQEREGVMLWDIEISEKMTRGISMSFFVKYPKDDPPYEI